MIKKVSPKLEPILIGLFFCLTSLQAQETKHYPQFSWATVPVGFHFGKSASLLTAEEAEFVASHASFICLEKGHASKQFIYNWGYRMELGCLEWYPELDKKLGPPLMDAKQTGWILEREFEHASVWIDLEAKEARIDWH